MWPVSVLLTRAELKMLIAADFKWAFAKGKGQERSTFGRLLLLLVCTPHDTVYVHTRELLRKVRVYSC